MLQSVFYLLFEKSFRLFLSFLISIWFARYLGPNDFGSFQYIISFGFLFIPFYTMGADDATIKGIKEHPDKLNNVMGTSFMYKFFGGLIGTITAISICIALDGINEIVGLLFIYLMATWFKVFDNISDYFQAKLDLKKVSMARNIVLIIITLLKITFILLKLPWQAFIYLASFDVFIIYLFYFKIYKNENKNISDWNFRIDKSLNFSKTCVPIFVITFMIMAINKIDHIMIKHMVGVDALGHYALMNKFIELSQFIPVSILAALFPKLVEFNKKTDQTDFIKTKKIGYSITIILGLLSSLSLYFLGDIIITGLYGAQYKIAGPLLEVYGVSTFFIFLTLFRIKLFTATNNLKLGIMVLGVALLSNIGLNYYLIPQFDIIGAVYASILSYAIGEFVGLIISAKLRSEFFFALHSMHEVFKKENLGFIKSLK